MRCNITCPAARDSPETDLADTDTPTETRSNNPKPVLRPADPRFSCGPVKKYPGWSWDALADAGTISDQDLDLFQFVESADEAMKLIENWDTAPAREEVPGRSK